MRRIGILGIEAVGDAVVVNQFSDFRCNNSALAVNAIAEMICQPVEGGRQNRCALLNEMLSSVLGFFSQLVSLNCQVRNLFCCFSQVFGQIFMT